MFLDDDLPPHVAATLAMLESNNADAHGALLRQDEKIKGLREAKFKLDYILQDLVDAGGHLKREYMSDTGPDDVTKIENDGQRNMIGFDQRRLDNAKQAVKAKENQIDIELAKRVLLEAAWDDASRAHTRASEYVQSLPLDARLDREPLEPVKLRKGESDSQADVRIRKQIEDLKQAALDTAAAPISSAEAKKVIDRQVLLASIEGIPGVVMTIARGEPARFKLMIEEGQIAGVPAVPDAFRLMAWLFPKELTAKMHALVDDQCGGDLDAISAQDRADKLRQIAADLWEAECQHESLVLESDGKLRRRGDAEVRAVLQVSSKLPPFRD